MSDRIHMEFHLSPPLYYLSASSMLSKFHFYLAFPFLFQCFPSAVLHCCQNNISFYLRCRRHDAMSGRAMKLDARNAKTYHLPKENISRPGSGPTHNKEPNPASLPSVFIWLGEGQTCCFYIVLCKRHDVVDGQP